MNTTESVAYFEGAREAMLKEFHELHKTSKTLVKNIEDILWRLTKQFSEPFATSPWNSDTNKTPKDGREILIQFRSGLIIVAHWASDLECWMPANTLSPTNKLKDDIVRWAEINIFADTSKMV